MTIWELQNTQRWFLTMKGLTAAFLLFLLSFSHMNLWGGGGGGAGGVGGAEKRDGKRAFEVKGAPRRVVGRVAECWLTLLSPPPRRRP